MKKSALVHLGAKPFGRSVANYGNVLKGFESLVGRLPQAYAQLLSGYRGAAIRFDKDVRYRPMKRSPWDRKSDGSQSLNMLYGLSGESSLPHQQTSYTNRMADGVIPVGDAPGGNVICLALRTGKLYLWDHEDERPITGNAKNDYGNMYLIADSFDRFLKALYVEEDSDNDDDNIDEVWLADDLK